jgi:HPr kinase/phosphorylase
MFQISVARLYEDNRETLQLAWIAGRPEDAAQLQRDGNDAPALIGHLNLIHPNRIQVFGEHEAAHLRASDGARAETLLRDLFASRPAAVLLADDIRPDARLLRHADAPGTPIIASALPGGHVIERLRRYLGKVLADRVELHGVLMDVLGLGVLITGDSGVGKSELGLELISRGHGLVADDVVEISRIAAATLEGRCPPMLKDFLEVRGLGILNIRTIFGETAVRPKMNLKLIVHLERPSQPGAEIERLPLHAQFEDILGVTVSKVVIPVAAGRNLAVLLEAAVRNRILQLRGIHSTAEFTRRQQAEIRRNGDGSDDADR